MAAVMLYRIIAFPSRILLKSSRITNNFTSFSTSTCFRNSKNGNSKFKIMLPPELTGPNTVRNIHKEISPLTTKRVRRRRSKEGLEKKEEFFEVYAFATAQEYNLEFLKNGLAEQGLYEIKTLPSDVEDALHVTAKYLVGNETREMYLFREGSVVFWNMAEVERNAVLKFLTQYQDHSYDYVLMHQESEQFEYSFSNQVTKLSGNCLYLDRESKESQLEKYAFSNALSASVKLAIWEASLEKYIDSIEFILKDMKAGKRLRITREEQLRKTGELYTLKHYINLTSDLLDTPDFYWDRASLEKIYVRTGNYLNVPKRTRVINEKLSHCSDLAELLINYLNDKHSSRLEWFIIWLIAIEVGFESFKLLN